MAVKSRAQLRALLSSFIDTEVTNSYGPDGQIRPEDHEELLGDLIDSMIGGHALFNDDLFTYATEATDIEAADDTELVSGLRNPDQLTITISAGVTTDVVVLTLS